MTGQDQRVDSARFSSVSFLSDYGQTDESVGVITAVIHDLAPHASIVHVTHGVAPFDVRAGSLALARSVAYLPAGVILAIVEPRGPFRRRPIAIEVADGAGVFVGPDNGLLAPAVAMAGGAERAVHLDNPEFHLTDTTAGSPYSRGRDIYAPVVAGLLNGADLYELGSAIDLGELLPGTIPLPRTEGETIIGEVLSIDRFGNAQLNVGPDEVPAEWGERVQLRVESLGMGETVRTLQRVPLTTLSKVSTGSSATGGTPEVPGGAILLYDDPHGMTSLAMIERSVATELGIAPGDRIVLAPFDESNSPRAATTTRVEFGQRPDTPRS